jgi:CRP-like cAMP-binding protein
VSPGTPLADRLVDGTVDDDGTAPADAPRSPLTQPSSDPPGPAGARPLTGVAVREVLARLALFSQLDPEHLDVVHAGTRQRRLARGEVLFHAGEPCTAFFCVVSGQVKLTLSAPDGGEKVLEIISAGETFGEAVMFAGRPYPVSATALLGTVLLTIPATVVLDLVADDPIFARRMLAGMSVRLHTMINDVEAISLRTGTHRVVGLLLGLAGDPSADGPAGPYPVLPPVTVTLTAGKAVLASRLNLTPETFSRSLRELTAAGLITVRGRQIVLLDQAGLAAAAGAGPAG